MTADRASSLPDTPARPVSGATRVDVPRLGLRANWRQFSLLVLVNAFVGAMVGLERTVLPLIAERDFGLSSRSAALSFIATFGVVKALTNLAAGRLGDRFGRKHALVAGWLFALPVPMLIWWAPTWGWVVFANVLLGLNQGLAWSTTVIMKIDLVGPERRGLAMGLNEFAGYLAVALSALVTGYLAGRYGLRLAPAYVGAMVAVVGLVLSLVAVRETSGHAAAEAGQHRRVAGDLEGGAPHRIAPTMWAIFARASWRDRALFNASQAGLVQPERRARVGTLPALVRERGPLGTPDRHSCVCVPGNVGNLSALDGRDERPLGKEVADRRRHDRTGDRARWDCARARPRALARRERAARRRHGDGLSDVAAAVGDVADPMWRGLAIGVYRLRRDMGYAVGAVLAGVVADAFGMRPAVVVVAVLTAASGALVIFRMPETRAERGTQPRQRGTGRSSR